MKKIFLLLLITQYYATAQDVKLQVTDSIKVLSDAECQKAIALYLDMSLTQTYKEQRMAVYKLVRGLSTIKAVGKTESEEMFREWLSENLAETKFSGVEEAILLWKQSVDLQIKLESENPEVFELITRATTEQAKLILVPDTDAYFELRE